MRIIATHSDGFTEHLLGWRLIVNDSKAFLQASWFMSVTPVSVRFSVDEALLTAALGKLSPLAEEYQAACEDLENQTLELVEGAKTIRSWHVYGASRLSRERPEIQLFITVWNQFEALVTPYLPAEIRR